MFNDYDALLLHGSDIKIQRGLEKILLLFSCKEDEQDKVKRIQADPRYQNVTLSPFYDILGVTSDTGAEDVAIMGFWAN